VGHVGDANHVAHAFGSRLNERIGSTTNGGDIGCRYTAEMIEMCQMALELRAKGIIKF
jgi:hypothetical protein